MSIPFLFLIVLGFACAYAAVMVALEVRKR